MATYNIGLNAARTIAYVSIDPEALPAEATIVLTDAEHNDADDAVHAYAGNHVLFHHIRDLLYKRKAADGASGATYPNGMYDLSRVSIVKSGDFWDATGLAIEAVSDIEEAATDTLVITLVPSDAVVTNTHCTFESDDTDTATVSSAGVVTGVAAGTATITVTHTALGLTAEVDVTIVEPA